MSRSRRALVLSTTASLAALAVGGPASAVVTASTTDTTLQVGSVGGADTVLVTCQAGEVAVNGTLALPALACGDATAITVAAGDLDDRVDLRGVTAARFGSLAAVTITGDDGQDTLLGARGTVDGGGGNDRIINPVPTPATTIQGGAGTDSVEFDYTDAPDVAVSFTINDTAYSNGTLVPAAGIEQYVLSLPDGVNDVSDVNSAGYSGRVVARLHSGADTFTGGPGDDYVAAGPGNDIVNPGSGRDAVNGGESEDVIYTLDGEVDTVDCGDGADTITADRGDLLRNCETVNLPPLPPPAPPAAPETSKVVGLKKVTKGTKASFVFVSASAGATFECRVDNKSWRSCTSPFKLNTRNQKVGKHKVYVRATLNGVTDATPSKFGFRVLKPKRR